MFAYFLEEFKKLSGFGLRYSSTGVPIATITFAFEMDFSSREMLNFRTFSI